MQTSQLKKEKVILLVIMLLSSIFALGCSIDGKKDDTIVRYDFCPGTYSKNSSTSYNMFYYGTNQSKASGYILDTNGKRINGSSFSPAINPNKNGWLTDGFYYNVDNSYPVGSYTLRFNVGGRTYQKTVKMSWEKLPKWKEFPDITYDADSHIVTVAKIPDITETSLKKQYIIKAYVASSSHGSITTSKLYGQSEILKEGKGAYISYSLSPVSGNIRLVPVLVCELLSKDNKLMGSLFCEGPAFNL